MVSPDPETSHCSSHALPVLPLPRHGSSGTGISYYTQVIRCPRKAVLDKELAEAGEQHEKNEGSAAVGTIVHQLDELYYGGITDNPLVLQLSDINWSDAVTEARRVWTAYRSVFPGQDFWGEVMAMELALPQNHPQEVIVESVIGTSPFTIRIDRVIRVTAESAQRIAARTDLKDLKPGVYLFDRKTKGKQDGDALLTYQNSLQFAAYQMVYNAIFPSEPALGMIVDELITTKDPKFRHFLITPPDEHQQAAVRTMIKNAKALEPTNAALGVAYGCRDYNRVCEHLGTRCVRY